MKFLPHIHIHPTIPNIFLLYFFFQKYFEVILGGVNVPTCNPLYSGNSALIFLQYIHIGQMCRIQRQNGQGQISRSYGETARMVTLNFTTILCKICFPILKFPDIYQVRSTILVKPRKIVKSTTVGMFPPTYTKNNTNK